MFKAFFIAIFFISISMSLTTTFAAEAVEQSGADRPAPTETAATDTTTKAEEATDEIVSVMDTPVNFSTPEDVEKSFQLISEQAGEDQLKGLKIALSYIMTYDLSVGHDKEKMYKKLNGRTPNQIISKMNR